MHPGPILPKPAQGLPGEPCCAWVTMLWASEHCSCPRTSPALLPPRLWDQTHPESPRPVQEIVTQTNTCPAKPGPLLKLRLSADDNSTHPLLDAPPAPIAWNHLRHLLCLISCVQPVLLPPLSTSQFLPLDGPSAHHSSLLSGHPATTLGSPSPPLPLFLLHLVALMIFLNCQSDHITICW